MWDYRNVSAGKTWNVNSCHLLSHVVSLFPSTHLFSSLSEKYSLFPIQKTITAGSHYMVCVSELQRTHAKIGLRLLASGEFKLSLMSSFMSRPAARGRVFLRNSYLATAP